MIKMPTPWGVSHYVHFHGADKLVVRVGTAEHGGIGVDASILMPPALAALAMLDSDGRRWFEEDVCWAAAVIALPDRFPADWVESAQNTLCHSFPDAYMAHFNVVLTAADSRAIEEREFHAKTQDNFIVTAAWGSAFWDVGTGSVYACGWRRRDEATAGFLVPEGEYQVAPSRLILDNYPRWEPDRSLPFVKPEREASAGWVPA